MPKINTIVKVEKKEKFSWQSEFQYLLDRKILSRDELAYLFGQIKSIVEQGQEDYGNKSVGLDKKKVALILFAYHQPGIVIEEVLKTVIKSPYYIYLVNLWEQCFNQAQALKDTEDKIIVEVKG